MTGDVILLQEVTLPRFLFAIMMGRKVQLLSVSAAVPPLQGILVKIADLALASGRASLALDDLPECKDIAGNITLVYAHDVFAKLESWQNQYLNHAAAARHDARYGRAVMLAGNKHFHWLYVTMFMLEELSRRFPDRRVYGVGADLLAATRAYFGADAAAHIRTPSRIGRRPVNLLSAAVAVAATLLWMISRVRFNVRPQGVFLSADILNDPRDRYVLEELADGGDILLVPRNEDIQDTLLAELKGYKQCLPREGWFTPGGFMLAAVELMADGFRLLRLFGGMDPRLFYQIAAFPFRRLVYRALFTRYPTRFFWGRDDYQVEHILRRYELRRIGGTSMGISHAMQGICILHPSWRYIEFDIYYLMGQAFEPYYRDTWAADMVRKSVGTFGFTREQLTAHRRASRTVVVMTRYAVGDAEVVEAVHRMADLLPDHAILLQVKRGYPHDALIPDFIEACCAGHPNVRYTEEDVYDLMLQAAVIVTDPSTVVAESLQIGVPAVVMDVVPIETCLFRDYPNLSFRTAEDIASRVFKLLSGAEAFDFSAFRDLFNAGPELIYDVIRTDMGLTPRPALT